jgi:hypothetical protein
MVRVRPSVERYYKEPVKNKGVANGPVSLQPDIPMQTWLRTVLAIKNMLSFAYWPQNTRW